MPMTDHFPAAGDDIGRSAELQPAQLTCAVSAARVKAPRSHRGSAGQGACWSGAGANHILHVLLTAFSLLSFASGLHAEIRLAALFRDGAVLQRDRPVPIWGSAIAREEIRVQFGAQMAAALVLLAALSTTCAVSPRAWELLLVAVQQHPAYLSVLLGLPAVWLLLWQVRIKTP